VSSFKPVRGKTKKFLYSHRLFLMDGTVVAEGRDLFFHENSGLNNSNRIFSGTGTAEWLFNQI